MSRQSLFAISAAAALMAVGLAGCGKMGQLERPGPMFGHKSAADAAPPAADPARPVETVDPRDRDTSGVLPPRTDPAPAPR